MKQLLTTLAFYFTLTTFNLLVAQPTIQWEYTYGGTDFEGATDIIQTIDGGFLVVGHAKSVDGDVSSNYGNYDFWVVKLDINGTIQWEKNYGGTVIDGASSVTQDNQGNYYVIGETSSMDGDVTVSYGGEDIWLIKLNSVGNLIWQKTYGGSNTDNARKIISTDDNGIVFCGFTESNDGDVNINKGNRDYWLVKIDTTGNVVWEKTYGGSLDDEAYSLIQTDDDGYLILGESNSNDGDLTNNIGNDDFWVVKTDSIGNIEWEKNYGGTDNERGLTCNLGINGGYILAGRTFSNDGDVSNHFGGTDRNDYWVVKIDSVGILEWENSYGGTQGDEAVSVLPYNGNYVVLGNINSSNGMISNFYGDTALTSPDYWLIQIDTLGNLMWEKNYGGSYSDFPYAMLISNDNSIVMTGSAASIDYDVKNNDGVFDIWVVKLNALTDVEEIENELLINIYPNPNNGIFNFNASVAVENIEVINLLGEQLVKKTIKSKQAVINMQQYPKGVYYIRFTVGNELVTKKIICYE